MNKEILRRYIPVLIVWTLIVLYILFSQFAAYMGGDDWAYRSTTWGSILSDALKEYMTWNPRLPATMLTRIYSLSPWYLVDIASTIAFFLLCYIMLRLAFGKEWKEPLKRWETPLCLVTLLLYVIPKSSELFFWHCGIAFYCWSLVYNFALLLWLRSVVVEENPVGSWLKVVLLGVPLSLAAAMGMYSSGGLVFLAALVAVYIVKKRGNNEDYKKLLFLAIVLGIGLLAVVAAPGNFHRMEVVKHVTTDTVKGAVIQQAQTPQARFWRLLPGVLPGLLLMCVMAGVFLKRCVKRTWSKNDIIFIALCAVAAVIMAVPVLVLPTKSPSRAYAACYIMVCLAALRLMYTGPALGRFGKCMFRAALLVPVLVSVAALPSQWNQYQWWLKVSEHIDQPACQTCEIPYNPSDTLYCAPQSFWYGALLKNFNAEEITENPVRCFYEGTVAGAVLKGSLTEAPLHYLYDSFTDGLQGGTLRLELTGRDAETLPDSVAVAYYVTPLTAPYIGKAYELWANAVQADTVSRSELEKQPHWVIQTAEKHEGAYVLKWEDYPASLKRPKCPDIWVALPDASGQQMFSRISAKPSWR